MFRHLFAHRLLRYSAALGRDMREWQDGFTTRKANIERILKERAEGGQNEQGINQRIILRTGSLQLSEIGLGN